MSIKDIDIFEKLNPGWAINVLIPRNAKDDDPESYVLHDIPPEKQIIKYGYYY